MNFELTDEQRLLQDSVLRFARDHYDFSAWRGRTACRKPPKPRERPTGFWI